MKNKARVHMLPTEDASHIHTLLGEIVYWVDATSNKGRTGKRQPQHLYITTDEEIKEGDWFYYNYNGGVIGQYKKGMGEVDGKIIATTDPKLTSKTTRLEKITNPGVYEKPLPQTPQSFIEEYCKAGGIDEVLVEYEERFIKNSLKNYKRMLDEVIEVVPKLDSNNCIIIHPVKEKMYSREEVELIVAKAMQWNGRLTVEVIDKWIEENL